MMLVANLANTKLCKKVLKWLKLWHMDTHLTLFSESFLLNTIMTGFAWLSKNLCFFVLWMKVASALEGLCKTHNTVLVYTTGELGYDGPLYDGFLHMTDDMLGPSPMHIKYSSYVYDGFCTWQTNFPGPIESVISKFTCSAFHQINNTIPTKPKC